MKEVVNILHSHREILKPELKWKNCFGVELRFIDLVSADRHRMGLLREMAEMLTEE